MSAVPVGHKSSARQLELGYRSHIRCPKLELGKVESSVQECGMSPEADCVVSNHGKAD